MSVERSNKVFPIRETVFSFWKKLSLIGTSEIENDRLKRKIIICNQLAFTVSVLPIFTSIYLLVIIKTPFFFSPLIIGFLYLATLLFNKLQLHSLSRIYLTILPTINLLVLSGLLSDKYCLTLKIPYISIIVAPIVLFDLHEKAKLLFCILWVIFMYYVTDILNPYIPVPPSVDPLLINNLMMINFSSLLTFVILISGFLYLQRINLNAEEKMKLLILETQSQKSELEIKNKTITDSIHYAKNIQNAVLPKHIILKQYCNDYFIIYKPKDIVSGDFYTINIIDKQLIISIADCTGHGIPGALMSMLGMSFFSETLRKPEIKKPDEILTELRHQIKNALKQQDFTSKSKDSIDMAVVTINTDTNEAQFSGANRPLYLIKAKSTEIIEIKPDKTTVGVHSKEINFNSLSFQIEKGDSLYLFSDGYEDQFANNSLKKMSSKQFREQLLSMQNLTMKEQQHKLEDLHEKWRGTEAQTDDILIFGIRF